jgi:hypothetical protein
MQWKHKFSESQNFRSLSVCWKGMWLLCVFWDVGVIYVKFMLHEPARLRRHAATTAWGCSGEETGRLSRGVILRHDSAVPHRACRKQVWLQSLQWEIVDHPPLILTFRLWTVISWGCLTTDAKIDSSIMRKCKWLYVDGCKCKSPISSRGGFFFNSCQVGQMHHCAWVLCRKMILHWKKWATFNAVMASHLIAVTYGIFITEHFSEVAISKIVMTTSFSTSHSRVTVCFRLYFIVCVCVSHKAHWIRMSKSWSH